MNAQPRGRFSWLISTGRTVPVVEATAYFGILSPAILSKIEKSVPNLPSDDWERFVYGVAIKRATKKDAQLGPQISAFYANRRPKVDESTRGSASLSKRIPQNESGVKNNSMQSASN